MRPSREREREREGGSADQADRLSFMRERGGKISQQKKSHLNPRHASDHVMICCCSDRDQSWTKSPDICVFPQMETMVYRADTTSSRLFKILREKINQVNCHCVLTFKEENGAVVCLGSGPLCSAFTNTTTSRLFKALEERLSR